MADGLAQPIQYDWMQQPGTVNTNVGFDPVAGGQGGLAFQQQPGVPGMPGAGGSPGGGFDWGNAMSNFSMGAEGAMGLANAYTAYKQLGLMEDQLSLQKGVANRNIANQAATTNRMLEDRASMAAQMTGGAEYGTEAHRKAKEKLQTTVSGAPVA